MAYQFAGFFATPRVAKPQQLADRAVWRDITEPFVGVGVLLPSFLGKSPSAPAVTELAKQLGVACAENWLYVTYDCRGGEVDFVYGLGSRGGVPFGPLSADESAQLTYTELMLQFGIPQETAMDFAPFRRGFWGETQQANRVRSLRSPDSQTASLFARGSSLALDGPAFSDRRRTRKPKGTPNKTNLSDVMDTTRFVLKPNLKWHKEDDTFARYGSPADGRP